MKIKIYHIFKIIRLLTIALFITNCERFEENSITEEQQEQQPEASLNNNKAKYVKPEEVPDVINTISNYTGKSVIAGKGVSYENSYIDINKVLQVVSKGNKTNYTFPIYVKDQPESEFYNLIVHKDSLGNIKEPYIRRYKAYDYVMDEYRANDYDFRYFRGTYQIYSFGEFFGTTGSKQAAKGLAYIDPDCDDGGTIGGGSGGTNNPDLIDMDNNVTWTETGNVGYTRPFGPWNDYGGTGGYDLEVEVYNTTAQTNEVASVNSITTRGTVDVKTGASTSSLIVEGSTTYIRITTNTSNKGTGNPCYTVYEIDVNGVYYTSTSYFDCGGAPVQLKGSISHKIESCTGDDGDVGVVSVKDLTVIVERTLGYAIGSAEYNWLAENSVEFYLIKDFLETNKIDGLFTEESKAFSREATEAFMDGGEVDFEDRIINTLTGKAKCVYDKLLEANGNLFKSTIGTFIENPKYNLILEIGNCSNTDVACTNGQSVGTTGEVRIIIEDITQPELELAATILHEGIHAEIFRYVDMKESGYVDPNDRPRLFQLYQYYKELTTNPVYNGDPVSDAQHQYMAENYVTPIAKAIRQLDGYKYSLDYYMWYGWQGLESTYNFKHKLTSNQKTDYIYTQQQVNTATNVKCN